MDKPKTYWDTFTERYQMGKQKHRVYMLNLLRSKGVESLLDVGCGTGPIYEILKEDNDPMIYKGTDYSPAMIEICQREFPDGNFEVEDARRLTEENNSWDCVLLMHSLDHLDDYEAAINEAARVSKKYVCIILWRPLMDVDYNNLNDRNMYGKSEGEDPWEDTHLQDYSKNLLGKAFEKAGLSIEMTVDGDLINSDQSHYNFLYLLKKNVN